MKIVLVSGSFPEMPCGVGDYTSGLAAAIVKVAPDVKVEVITSEDTRVRPSSGIILHEIKGWGCRYLGELMRLLATLKPDLLHIQYPTRGYGKGLAPNLLPLVLRICRPNLPVVVTLHEFTIAHPLRKLSSLFLIFCPHRLVACDGREQRMLNRLRKLRGGRVELIPLGANIPMCVQGVLRGNGSDRITFCHFGFLDKSKDGTLLIDVLAKLRQEQFPVRLVFVGEITPDKQAWFRKLAEDRGVAEAVSFTGFCSPEDVSRYLASSDIGLFPFRDGVSLRRTSFLAAMQHGLAVVTTQAGNYVPTELVDGENVLLVPAGDRERFVQAARRLALDATLRHKLSVNARRWGASFAWEIIARRHLALYRQFSGLGTEEGTGK